MGQQSVIREVLQIDESNRVDDLRYITPFDLFSN